MTLTEDAVAKALPIIKNFEGFREKAYRNSLKEPWTVGYGFTYDEMGNHIKEHEVWTRERADKFMVKQIIKRVAAIQMLVKVPVKATQLAALTSLQFNIGPVAFAGSTVLRRLNAGDYAGAASAFTMWHRGNAENDLLPRRRKERDLFNSV